MGFWWALWLTFTFPQILILEGQTPTMLPGFPQMTSFQSNQFQGEWFVLGLAGNIYGRMDQILLNPFITLFELKNNNHIQVTNSMTRGKRCDTWSYTLIPAAKPGQFTVDHKGSGPGTDSEDVRVIETDYTKFALMLAIRQTNSQTIIRVSLLGRDWRLPPRTMDKFICLARTQSLTKNNFVFPDVTDLPQVSETVGDRQCAQGHLEEPRLVTDLYPEGRVPRPSPESPLVSSPFPLPAALPPGSLPTASVAPEPLLTLPLSSPSLASTPILPPSDWLPDPNVC